MSIRLAETTAALLVMASLTPSANAADVSVSSSPPRFKTPLAPHNPRRHQLFKGDQPKAGAADGSPPQIDVVVNNTDPNLKNIDTLVGTEPGIAVDPKNNNRIVITVSQVIG